MPAGAGVATARMRRRPYRPHPLRPPPAPTVLGAAKVGCLRALHPIRERLDGGGGARRRQQHQRRGG